MAYLDESYSKPEVYWLGAALVPERAVDVLGHSHACRLRHKLGVCGDRYIVNVWGVGYRLTDAPVDDPACATFAQA